MNGNFNMVKKKKEEDIVEEEQDTSSESSGLDGEFKSKMIKLMGFILIGVVVLFIILYVLSACSPKSYTYREIENILKTAAVDYFKEYPQSLPTANGNIIEIDSSALSDAGMMKDLGEYLPEGVACSGKVQVQKTDDTYLYTPYLNCGESYATEELYKKIVNEANIVSSGYGLYAHNGSYIFRGEIDNNYVQLDKSLWRIVKVTSNNNIVLINEVGTTYDQPWDNRYNKEELYDAGKNDYEISRIRDYLSKVYQGVDEKLKDDELLLSKGDRSHLVPYNLCIGKKSANSSLTNNSEECSKTIKEQMVGLLTLSDFMYASLDKDCNNGIAKSCKNYNYLVNKKDWWLLTGDKDSDVKVYRVTLSGYAELCDASSYADVRPVIYLNSRVLYRSGNGTKEKPYKIR